MYELCVSNNLLFLPIHPQPFRCLCASYLTCIRCYHSLPGPTPLACQEPGPLLQFPQIQKHSGSNTAHCQPQCQFSQGERGAVAVAPLPPDIQNSDCCIQSGREQVNTQPYLESCRQQNTRLFIQSKMVKDKDSYCTKLG